MTLFSKILGTSAFPRLFSAGVLLLFAAQSALPQVTGRVVDKSGNPVPFATITYANCANRLTWTYAGEDGRFTLPDPTKAPWKSGPIITGCLTAAPTSVSYPTANPEITKLDPLMEKGAFSFTLPENGNVFIALYGLSGAVLWQKTLFARAKGRYAINPFRDIAAKYAANVYVMAIHSASEAITFKVPYFNGTAFAVFGPPQSKTGAPALMKTRASTGIDTVRAGRTAYFPAIKPIDSYNQNVGDISIVQYNIEARIDSVIAAAQDSPYVYLNQCMMHNNWDTPEVSAGKSAGAHFMAGDVKPAVTGDPRLAAGYATYMNGWRTAHQNSLHKIPFITGYDAVHGVNMCDNTTIFPHNIGMGAMRDLDLAQVAYRVTAIEMAGTGCTWTFAPCVAVVRNIGWGRTYESFGESPDLVARYARAAVLGLQTTDLSYPLAVMACAKHFAGDGGTAKGTSPADGGLYGALYDRGNTIGNDTILRAIHLAPYKAAVDLEVASVMASFSKWNGVFMHDNKALLTDWLKGEMNWKGWICGDYDAHTQVIGGERACMNAGLDMAMNAGTPPDKFGNTYQLMYDAGGDEKTRVLDASRRVLRMKMAMGLFDRPPAADTMVTKLAGCQLHSDVARACVRESMVLLKNQGNVLPLKKTSKIHIVGPHGDNLGYQCGGWTLGWAEQNLTNDAFIGATTIKAGFEKLSPGNITYAKDANTIPAGVDAVLVVFGEKVFAEWLGDSDDLGPTDYQVLPGDANPVQLIQGAKKAGKPVIGIMVASRPLIVSSYIDSLDAFVSVWLPGTEGGGVAEVLYGDYDFTGTLPQSWPVAFSQEPLNTIAAEYGGDLGDLKGTSGAAQWPYGYGLSYKNGVLKAPF